MLSRENGRGEVTRSEFNALGHETLRVLPPNQAGARELAFGPGIHGEVLTETDAKGNTTTHRYDGLGRRVLSTLPAVSGGGSDRSWSYPRSALRPPESVNLRPGACVESMTCGILTPEKSKSL